MLNFSNRFPIIKKNNLLCFFSPDQGSGLMNQPLSMLLSFLAQALPGKKVLGE